MSSTESAIGRALRRAPWLLVVVGTACASATSAADPLPTTATNPDTAGPTQTGDVLEAAGPTTSTQIAATTTQPVLPATTAASTTDPVPSAPEAVVVEDSEDFDGALDEPSFELGPEVVLDLDLARFAPDDAGQGGTGVAPTGGGATPSSVVPELTGWAAVDRSLESALLRNGNTAASVAILIDGDVVHAAAFGVRDPATGDPVEPEDRFRVASISKTITGIVAMRLVESGQVELDEPIGRRLADHVGLDSISPRTESLTLRQLLTHVSGFGKYQSTFFRSGAEDCVDAARQGLTRGAGGGGYTYSNMNFCLAGLAIEALTGRSYPEAVYRELLTPLQISGMRLAPTVDPGPGEVQHATAPGRNYMETLGGAGSWVASPTELVTILDSLDLSTPGYKPLTADGALATVTPSGGSFGQRGYALGVISYGGGRFGHTGTIESTHAMLLNRGDGVTWAITVAGPHPSESTALERIMNEAFQAGGFVAG
ncbi:MAG: serine hydrolase domain-containing protein [Ilumatobacter sp.]